MKDNILKHIQSFGTIKGFQMKYREDIEKHELYDALDKNFQMWAYHIIHEFNDAKICESCDLNKTSFRGFKAGYNRYCAYCGPKIGAKNAGDTLKKTVIIISAICNNCKCEYSYKTKNEKLLKMPKRKFCTKSCSTEHMHKNMSLCMRSKTNSKRKLTNKEKYGDEYVINSVYARKMTKNKLGVEYAFQSQSILLLCKNTLEENYGCRTPMESSIIKDKMIATKIRKYGDLLKPCYNYKSYVFPSGRIVKIQGYEDKAIDILLKTYHEKDIIVGRKEIQQYIGEFKYKDSNGIERRYYPDIYIKAINTIVEVKSEYTYNLHREKVEILKNTSDKFNVHFQLMIL